jgi:hypothetical protein
MSTPIIEQIAVKIEDLINAITVANGFNQDLAAVRPKRIHLDSDLNDDNTVFIYQDVGLAVIDTNEVMRWQQNFLLQALVIDSDDATASIDTRCNTVAADICKQLMSGTNLFLDGLVDGEWIDQIEIKTAVVDGRPQSLVEVTLTIMYQLSTSDPYSLG